MIALERQLHVEEPRVLGRISRAERVEGALRQAGEEIELQGDAVLGFMSLGIHAEVLGFIAPLHFRCAREEQQLARVEVHRLPERGEGFLRPDEQLGVLRSSGVYERARPVPRRQRTQEAGQGRQVVFIRRDEVECAGCLVAGKPRDEGGIGFVREDAAEKRKQQAAVLQERFRNFRVMPRI